jgi:hypothetical protein
MAREDGDTDKGIYPLALPRNDKTTPAPLDHPCPSKGGELGECYSPLQRGIKNGLQWINQLFLLPLRWVKVDWGMKTKINFFKKVKAINEIYLENSKRGLTAENIYRLYIRDRFFISRSSFYRYLTIPYKKEISG